MPSAAENITRHYNGDWHGSYGLIPTPGHSKTDRGTKIADGEGGDVLVHSYNGGDWKAMKDEFRSRGFLPDREQPQGLRVIQSSKPQPAAAHAVHLSPGQKIVATWEYRDGDRLLNRKHRIEPGRNGRRKDYAWDRPNGSGWVVGAGDERVPYRLNDLRNAAPAAVVLIVEGEKCADLANELGFVATSSKDWKPAFAEVIADRRVIILPDAGEAGEKIARAVQATLPDAHILNLPGLSDGEDIVDWARRQDHGADAEIHLRVLVDGLSKSGSSFDWPVLDLARCALDHAPAREWSLAEWMPLGKATLLTGDGGVGKSLLAQMLATCVAADVPMLGVETRRGRAAYVTWEDDSEELWRRQEAICNVLGVPMASLAGRLDLVSMVDATEPFLIATGTDGIARPTKFGQAIAGRMHGGTLDFLVLDNASQVASIDHNEVSEVAAFAHWVNAMAKAANGAVLLLHHPNKAGDDWLGSVAYTNQFRSRMLMKRAEGLDADARELTNPKANYARAGGRLTFRWYKGGFVRDEDLPSDQRAEIAANIMASSDNETFLVCLRKRNGERRAVSEKVSPTYAPKVFADMPEAKGVSKRRLEQAMNRLFSIGAIERAALWRGDDRKDVFGLRETAGDAENGCGQHCAGDVRETAGDVEAATAANTYTIPKGISGAATQAAAPPPSKMILAPGETGNDPITGFEEWAN